MSKGSSTYIGKLRSNFLGTKFTVYDAHPPYDGVVVSKSRSARVVGLNQVSPRVPAGNYPVSHISYELNFLGSRSMASPVKLFISTIIENFSKSFPSFKINDSQHAYYRYNG